METIASFKLVTIEPRLLRRMLLAMLCFVYRSKQPHPLSMDKIRIEHGDEFLRLEATNGFMAARWTEHLDTDGERWTCLLSQAETKRIAQILLDDPHYFACDSLGHAAVNFRLGMPLGGEVSFPSLDRALAPRNLYTEQLLRCVKAFDIAEDKPRKKSRDRFVERGSLVFRAAGSANEGVLVTSTKIRLVAILMPSHPPLGDFSSGERIEGSA